MTDVSDTSSGPVLPTNEELRPEITGFDPATQPGRHEFHSRNPAATLPMITKAAGLPPALREKAMAKLGGYFGADREAKEADAVREVLIENSRNERLRSGPGDGANELERETWQVNRDVADANAEMDKIEAELAEGTFDSQTGEKIFRFAPGTPAHKARLHRLTQLGEIVNDLKGAGGQLRLEKAFEKACDKHRAYLTERWLVDETERRANAQRFEEELQQRVADRMKMKRTAM
jgi:hypothetical protein